MTTRRALDTDLLAIAAARGQRDSEWLDEIETAYTARIPSGAAAGLRLCDLADDDTTAEWIEWALERQAGHWPPAFRQALRIVARLHFPHLLAGATDDERREAA